MELVAELLGRGNLHFAGLITSASSTSGVDKSSPLSSGLLVHSMPSLDLYVGPNGAPLTLSGPFLGRSAAARSLDSIPRPYCQVGEELFFLKVDCLRRSFLPLLQFGGGDLETRGPAFVFSFLFDSALSLLAAPPRGGGSRDEGPQLRGALSPGGHPPHFAGLQLSHDIFGLLGSAGGPQLRGGPARRPGAPDFPAAAPPVFCSPARVASSPARDPAGTPQQ